MSKAEVVLEYFKVLIWPSIIALSVFIIYRKNIASFIDRIWKLKFPGGELEVEKQKGLQSADEESSREDMKEALIQQKNLINDIKSRYKEQYQVLEENAQQVFQQLLNELSIKDIQLDFERIYNLIFGSQIALLELLLPIPEGESRIFLNLYYSRVKVLNSPTFDNWAFDVYVDFLIKNKLVEFTPTGNFRIIEKGRGFLSYITNLGYPKNKNL